MQPEHCAGQHDDTHYPPTTRGSRTWHHRFAPRFQGWHQRLLSSPGELEITFKTSDVAVCCSSASSRSRVRWMSCFCRSATDGRLVNALRPLDLVRRSFPGFALPPRRFIRFTPPHLSSSYRPNKGFWKIIGRVRSCVGARAQIWSNVISTPRTLP